MRISAQKNELAALPSTGDNQPMSGSDPVFSRRRAGRDVIEDVGKALALGAVLLPVAGVLVRAIAFSVGGTVKYPLDLALQAPPAELIATGFVSLIPGLLALPLILIFAKFAPVQHLTQRYLALSPKFTALEQEFERSRERPGAEVPRELNDRLEALQAELQQLNVEYERLSIPSPKAHPNLLDRATNAMGRHYNLLTFTMWIAFILFGVWPASLTFLGNALIQLVLPPIAKNTGRVALSQVWPLVVVVLLIAAVASGLYGSLVGSEAGEYHFSADAQLANGRYARLGEGSNRTVLLSCAQPKPTVLAVDNSNIITVGLDSNSSKPEPFPWPTLVGVLTGHSTEIGFRNPC